ERQGGSTSLDRLGGLAKASPVLAVLFFVPAVNLAGIPPFSGFLGKVGLMQAGVEYGGPLAYTLVGAAAATSLLTLYAIATIWSRALWRRATDEPARGGGVTTALPVSMVTPTAVLVGFGLSLSVFAGPLYGFADRAAEVLRAQTPYIEAILG